MPYKNIFLVTFSVLAFYQIIGQSTPELVYMEDGQLVYTPFAMTGQSDSVNTIPDFSHAGYMCGGVVLPTVVEPSVTINPEPGDDRSRIQEAIAYVENLPLNADGIRGVILITTGHYSLEAPLIIRASGVILRGEGQGLGGTVLHANLRVQHNVISILGSGGIIIDEMSRTAITSSYVSVGSHTLEVADPLQYDIGDKIVVTRSPNEDWIYQLGMDQETLCAGKANCVGWTTSSYTIDHERTITAINGSSITLDIPIVDVIEDTFGGGSIAKVQSSRRISQCGIEHLRIQSFYDTDVDEDHAWTAVLLRDTENCWVKNITGQYLGYSTVNIDDSHFTTIQDCAYIDPKSRVTGGRRYSFAIQDGLGNLFQRCYAKSGRHDFVTGSRVEGPNVFLDGLAEDTKSDIGPHHRWATGSLFDNIGGGSTRVWNRGNSGTGHGWSGAQTMFWNIQSYTGEFRVDSPHGSMNWGIGCTGSNQTGDGYWSQWGEHVEPRSLYLQQLQDRLGTVAVGNVVISEQKTNDIYDLLANWAGQGDFAQGGFTGAVPQVAFANPTEPIDVSTWQAGDIVIDASDSDGDILSVKLLINGEPLATDDTAPYIFAEVSEQIQALPHTLHYLQAIATDNEGNTSSTRIAVMGGEPPLQEEEEPEDEIKEISVFPNPSSSQELTIQMTVEDTYTVAIIDLAGRLIHEFNFEGVRYQGLECNMASGLYVVQIRNQLETVHTAKMVLY